MPYGAFICSWLVYSALVSLVVLALGSGAVLLYRQPTRRLRIIELTLVGCLISPWLGMIPGYPQWAIGWWPVSPPERHEAVAIPSMELAFMPVVPQPDAASRSVSNSPSRSIAEMVETPAAAWDVGSWLVALYLFGVAMGVAWWLVGVAALTRIIWTARAAPPHCRRLLAEIAGPRSDRVRLLVSRRAKQPFASVGVAVQLPPQRATWRRAVIVLPEDLCDDEQAVRWALAHEWAHIERHDFRAWFVVGLARVLLYYQPLVWWLRRHLRLCQDLVADARASREASQPEDYAEFLTRRATAGSLHPAMVGLGMGFRHCDLYRRVVMLVQNPPLESCTPRLWNAVVSLAGLVLIGVLASLTLTPASAAQEKLKVPQWDSPVARKVNFVIASKKFEKGDNIEIKEVLSKRGTMTKGDIVIVRGTYTLTSRYTATLFIGITHPRKDYQGGCNMERPARAGTVPFELELPIAIKGRLHISLYDVSTHRCFGSLYFGPARSSTRKKVKIPQRVSYQAKKVDFVIGPHAFADGDKIEIQEVRSELGTLEKGDTVTVKGTYTLASRETASLLFSITHDRSKGPQPGCVIERPIRSGTVPFELEMPVAVYGHLHISFHDVYTRGGGCFGTVYFGTYAQMQEISDWNVAEWMNRGRRPARSSTRKKVTIPQRDFHITKKGNFAIGPHAFPDGDKIEIQEVHSKLGTFERGDTVTVKGTYTLASRQNATLLFSVTQDAAKPQRRCFIRRPARAGTVPFELKLPVAADGHLHVGFYDVQTGGCFGTVYFGTYAQMQKISHWNVEEWMNQGH